MPGGTVTSALAIYETSYERFECRWEVGQGGEFRLEVLVPPNSRAKIILPSQAGGEEEIKWIESGKYSFTQTFDSQAGWPPKALVPPIFEAEDSFV